MGAGGGAFVGGRLRGVEAPEAFIETGSDTGEIDVGVERAMLHRKLRGLMKRAR